MRVAAVSYWAYGRLKSILPNMNVNSHIHQPCVPVYGHQTNLLLQQPKHDLNNHSGDIVLAYRRPKVRSAGLYLGPVYCLNSSRTESPIARPTLYMSRPSV